MKKKKDRKSQEAATVFFSGVVFFGLWYFLNVNFILSVIASVVAYVFAELIIGEKLKNLFKQREEK